MAILTALYDSIVEGKLELGLEITRQAISEETEPQLIINDYMIKAMEEIGQRFQDGKAFVPELLMAARAMKGSLELLKPLLKGERSAQVGKIVIGTVKGDLHDIGKNLVASMFEGCGFEVINLGIDVSAEKFVEAIKREEPDILCLSALLTTTMNYMKEIINLIEKEGLRNEVKIMIGGAPVTQVFADQMIQYQCQYCCSKGQGVNCRIQHIHFFSIQYERMDTYHPFHETKNNHSHHDALRD